MRHQWGADSKGCKICGIGPIEIRSIDDLQAINADLAAHYRVVKDIDARESIAWNGRKGFSPIGDRINKEWFSGTLDGNGHVISGLHIERKDENYIGLFAVLGGGTIRNLFLNGFASGKTYVGGLAGMNVDGKIINCGASTRVAGQCSVGGLVGGNRGEILESRVYAKVLAEKTSGGGMAGDNEGRIIKSLVEGHVIADSDAGCLVGNNKGLVSECKVSGEVKAGHEAGGVIGRNQKNGEVNRCAFSGNVEMILTEMIAGDYGGGIVGKNDGVICHCESSGLVKGYTELGGIAGDNGGRIFQCSALGRVIGINDPNWKFESPSTNIGGIAGSSHGYESKIDNCVACGEVIGGKLVGGLVGCCSEGISHSLSLCGVTAARICGAFMGWDYNEIGSSPVAEGCYGLTGKVSAGPGAIPYLPIGAEQKTEAELKQRQTYLGWDFENVWQINDGESFPGLRGLPEAMKPPLFEEHFDAEDLSLFLTCTGCGKSYSVGTDAIVMTTDMAMDTLRSEGITVLGNLRQDVQDDMVDTAEGISPERLPEVLAMAKDSSQFIRNSLRSGTSRRWVCRSCRAVNEYPNS